MRQIRSALPRLSDRLGLRHAGHPVIAASCAVLYVAVLAEYVFSMAARVPGTATVRDIMLALAVLAGLVGGMFRPDRFLWPALVTGVILMLDVPMVTPGPTACPPTNTNTSNSSTNCATPPAGPWATRTRSSTRSKNTHQRKPAGHRTSPLAAGGRHSLYRRVTDNGMVMFAFQLSESSVMSNVPDMDSITVRYLLRPLPSPSRTASSFSTSLAEMMTCRRSKEIVTAYHSCGGGVLGDVRVQFVEQSFEKVEDVVRQWMVERPEDVVTLESEAAKATSLRLNDAVKPFTLLFDFPVGFVVVICFDDAAAIVWFVGAFKLSYHLVGVVERRFGDGAQIGELALILLPIGGAITAACLVDAQDHVGEVVADGIVQVTRRVFAVESLPECRGRLPLGEQQVETEPQRQWA